MGLFSTSDDMPPASVRIIARRRPLAVWTPTDGNRSIRISGMIQNPVGKTKLVLLTEEGIAESERNIHQDKLMCSNAVSRRKPLRFKMTARDMPLNAFPYRESRKF